MATIETISAALKLVDSKKESLRKAFEDLQSQSSSLPSFNLNWSDLDSYFTSSKSSLEHKFNLLQSQQQKPKSQSQQEREPKSQSQFQSQYEKPQSQEQQKPNSQSQEQAQIEPSSRNQYDPETDSVQIVCQADPETDSVRVPARPKLKSFCEKMDGLGLRNYISERINVWKIIRTELPEALRSAPEPATFVLDSVVGFYEPGLKCDRIGETARSFCMKMLEELIELKVEIGVELKERAKVLALGWREKVSTGGNILEASAFLSLVVAYGLIDEFKMEDLIGIAVSVSRLRQGIKLCRAIIPGDRISDVIAKLISEGKQLIALKLICEFGLTEKFPLVPLLRSFVKDCKKNSAEVLASAKNSVKSQNNARNKETVSLRAAIKAIDDYKIECPKGFILKRLDFLEKTKEDEKEPPAAKNISGSKRPRTPAGGPPAHPTGPISSVPAFEQSHHVQPPQGFMHMQEVRAPYLTTPAAGLYGSSAGMTPASAGSGGGYGGQPLDVHGQPLYGYAGQPLDIHQNVMVAAQPHAYPPQQLQVPGGYVERPPVAYVGGYGLPPQHHLPYYPQ